MEALTKVLDTIREMPSGFIGLCCLAFFAAALLEEATKAWRWKRKQR